MPFELKPHQEVAVDKLKNGNVLCGSVGVGKSHTAVGYYLKNEAPKNVYVITTAKKRDKMDWQFIFGDVGMTRDPETTMGSIVIVDSWNNLDKYAEVTDAFFIFDEQRLVGTGAWVKAFYRIAKANHWIMLSATPGDNWLDYVPLFRANGFIKNITQFKEDHVIARWTGRYYQVQSYRQVGKLVKWRNQLLVDMPYERHTTRHQHDVEVTYNEELVRRLVQDRWHVYEERPLTDASELFRVMRKVVYSDESRLRAIQTLLKSHPKLIVFYNFDFELEILRTLGSTQSSTQSSRPEESSLTLQTHDRFGHRHSLTQTGKSQSERSSLQSSSSEASSQDQTDSSSPKTTSTSGSISTPTTRSSVATAQSEGAGRLAQSIEKKQPSLTNTNGDISPSKANTYPASFQIAEWNGHKHQEIPKTDSWVYLVQYVAGAEAWECTETDAMVFYSLPYSYKNYWQAHGRIDRLNTSFLDLHYYRLISKAIIDRGVSKALKAKKSFNEAGFADLTELTW